MNQVDNILVGGEDFVKVDDENPFSGSLGDHREECSHTHTQKIGMCVWKEYLFPGVVVSDGYRKTWRVLESL